MLCTTCAIILVVQLISPLTGGQVCLLAPSCADYSSGQACCARLTHVGAVTLHASYVRTYWYMAQDTQMELYIPHMHIEGSRMHVEVDRPMHTSVGRTGLIAPHSTLPGDDVQPVCSPAGVGGGVRAEQEETRPR